MTSAPDIVSKIREALVGAKSIVSRTADATLIKAFLVEYNKAMQAILTLDSLLAKEPVSLEKCAKAVENIGEAEYGHYGLDNPEEVAKAVLQIAGVPYAE